MVFGLSLTRVSRTVRFPGILRIIVVAVVVVVVVGYYSNLVVFLHYSGQARHGSTWLGRPVGYGWDLRYHYNRASCLKV